MIRNRELLLGRTMLTEAEKDGVGMDISVWTAEPGMTLTLEETHKETALLLISGTVRFTYDGQEKSCQRSNVFDQGASALHVCRKKQIVIHCDEACEVLIQQAVNEKEFNSVFYAERDIAREVFGDDPIKSTTRRIVTTVFDYSRAPYSNMVLGEIINQPGIWSSYPPHSHPQPEVYYYRFNLPQGFGTCFIGEEAYKVKDHAVALIEGGKTHPQNAAPGYAMYYVWMIPHQPKPWFKTRITDPDHEWLLDPMAEIIQVKGG